MNVARSGLAGFVAVVAVSLASGTPGSAYAADTKAPPKKEEKKPEKPPASSDKKDGNAGGSTSDAYKLRGNTGT